MSTKDEFQGCDYYPELLRLAREGRLGGDVPAGHTLEVHSCDGELGGWAVRLTADVFRRWAHLEDLPTASIPSRPTLVVIHESGATGMLL